MQQPQQAQKPITYFIVQPDQFQAVCNKLSTLPYQEIAGILQDFVGTSRAMFDPLPAAAPAPGAPVPNGNERKETINLGGNGSAPPAGDPDLANHKIDEAGNGWTRYPHKSADPTAVQDYEASSDTWWIKDPTPAIDTLPDPDESGIVDIDDKGGAK